LAWAAKEMGVVPCNILIPDHTPQNKRQAMEHYNGVLHPVPYDTWWKAIIHHGHRTLNGYFVHPAVNSHLIAGNGTIGLEILEDMPDIDAVVMPYGGGGLSCGVATVMKSLKPSVRCYATEVETAAPLSASLKAGHVVDCDYTPNFVDGIGGKSVLPEIFDLASRLLDGSLVVSLSQTANALKLLVEKARIVAEGAGAAPVAAALAGMAGHGKIVCVVSGGNIDGEKLIKILQGQLP
jgi:threonine dehydratase